MATPVAPWQPGRVERELGFWTEAGGPGGDGKVPGFRAQLVLTPWGFPPAPVPASCHLTAPPRAGRPASVLS